MSKLTHFDDSGQAHMVNVGDKAATKRIAIARGTIFMSESAFLQVKAGDNKKGDVLGIARIAAIQATKSTANLIPLCHPLALTHVHVDIVLSRADYSIILEVTTETFGATGVEMEALTGVSIGLLTIYDMVKAVDKSMRISDIQLLEKKGGKSGHYLAENKHALKD